MQKKLNKIALDTNLFLKKFVKRQKKSELIIPMKYGLFSGGKKIRSKISNFYKKKVSRESFLEDYRRIYE